MCCKDDDTTPTFPPTSVPTGGACDFEGGMCNWLVNQLAPGKFTRRRGETPSRNTGPRYDHTKKDSTGKLLTHSNLSLVPMGMGKVSDFKGSPGEVKSPLFRYGVFPPTITLAAIICNDIFDHVQLLEWNVSR